MKPTIVQQYLVQSRVTLLKLTLDHEARIGESGKNNEVYWPSDLRNAVNLDRGSDPINHCSTFRVIIPAIHEYLIKVFSLSSANENNFYLSQSRYSER